MSADAIERRLFQVERGVALLDLRALENRARAASQAMREITIAGLNGISRGGVNIPGASGTTITVDAVTCTDPYGQSWLIGDNPPGNTPQSCTFDLKHGSSTLKTLTGSGTVTFTNFPIDYYDVVLTPAGRYASPTKLTGVFPRAAHWTIAPGPAHAGDTVCTKWLGPMPTSLTYHPGAYTTSGPWTLTYDATADAWLATTNFGSTAYWALILRGGTYNVMYSNNVPYSGRAPDVPGYQANYSFGTPMTVDPFRATAYNTFQGANADGYIAPT